MKTKKEWDQDIIKITTRIHEKFPELSKFIAEIPVNESESEEIDVSNLADYYYSLEEIINQYAETHTAAAPKKA